MLSGRGCDGVGAPVVEMLRAESVRPGADGCGEHDDLVIALALACWRAGRAEKKRIGYVNQRLPGI